MKKMENKPDILKRFYILKKSDLIWLILLINNDLKQFLPIGSISLTLTKVVSSKKLDRFIANFEKCLDLLNSQAFWFYAFRRVVEILTFCLTQCRQRWLRT